MGYRWLICTGKKCRELVQVDYDSKGKLCPICSGEKVLKTLEKRRKGWELRKEGEKQNVIK